MENYKTFKILCIDGGGIKGLYSAQVLAELEAAYDVPFTESFEKSFRRSIRAKDHLRK